MAQTPTSHTGHSRFSHSRASVAPASFSTSLTTDAALLVQHLKDRADEIAVALLGEPSTVSRSELRWGRHGSLALRRTGQRRGLFMDHERGEGGSVVDLIRRELGVNFMTALEIGVQILGGSAQLARVPLPKPPPPSRDDTDVGRWIARKLWMEATPLAGTLGERYFVEQRRLDIVRSALTHAVRWHGGKRAVIALMTDAVTGLPVGVHRTFVDTEGRKLGRKMLGSQGVIRLSADEEVGSALGIAEGIEDALAVMLSGWRPVWVATSAGSIARLPVLAGIQALTIFADTDIAGRNAAETCAARWQGQGREVRISLPSEKLHHA